MNRMYVLWVHRGRELEVVELFKKKIKAMELEAYISDIFTPIENVYSGKKVRREVMMRGYVFLKADLRTEIVDILRLTPYVIKLLEGQVDEPLFEDTYSMQAS